MTTEYFVFLLAAGSAWAAGVSVVVFCRSFLRSLLGFQLAAFSSASALIVLDSGGGRLASVAWSLIIVSVGIIGVLLLVRLHARKRPES